MFLDEDKKQQIKKELYDYIDTKCIFRCDPQIRYVDGIEKGQIPTKHPSKNHIIYQFYLRNLTHNPIMLTHVSAIFLDDLLTKIKNKEENSHFQLCGLTTGSISLMTAIQMCALKLNINVNAFTIRKERKSYGLFNLIDGMPTEAPVIVVDDLINSGNSVSKCLDICRYEFGLIPSKNTYSIIKMESNINKFNYNDNLISINSIFTKDEFDYAYDPNKYWIPKDCDKSINKRPEYQQGILY